MARNLTWEQLLSEGAKHDTIVITGCQRSGTTFAAKAIAKQLGYTHYDEDDFGVEDMERFEGLLRKKNRKVIQAPAILHNLKPYEDKVFIIVMTRNPDDVAKSMIAHNWWVNEGNAEYNKFADGKPESPQHLYQTKIEFSYSLRAYELHYTELQKNDGFVRKEHRDKWGIKQTSN